MNQHVEAFMRDIAFDEGMGFGLGLGGPIDSADNARRRLADYVRRVRREAPAGTADEHERQFRLALEQRLSQEIARTADARARAHLDKVLVVVNPQRKRKGS